MSGMVDWMVGQMRKDPPEKIFFLARDGQIVQEVWQRRVPSDLSGISTHYLLASRRALCMAAIRSLDTPALDFLTKTPLRPDAAGAPEESRAAKGRRRSMRKSLPPPLEIRNLAAG